jgi:hypothetical protein
MMRDDLSVIAAYFARQQQWPSRRSERPEGVEVTHEWHAPPFKSHAHVVNRGPAFVYDSICPEEVPPQRRGAVAHFIARVNFELSVGAFSMDWDRGVVRCRSAIDLRTNPLTDAMIDGVVYPHHQVLVDFLPHLLTVVRGEMEPDDAFVEAIEQLR